MNLLSLDTIVQADATLIVGIIFLVTLKQALLGREQKLARTDLVFVVGAMFCYIFSAIVAVIPDMCTYWYESPLPLPASNFMVGISVSLFYFGMFSTVGAVYWMVKRTGTSEREKVSEESPVRDVASLRHRQKGQTSMASDSSSIERERIIIEVGVVSVTLLLGATQLVEESRRIELLSFVSGIAACFIIASFAATISIMVEEKNALLKSILQFFQFVPFTFGLLMLLAMFLMQAMLIPRYANIFWLAVAYSVIGALFTYRAYRHQERH
jgi:hypothetical protein